MEFKLTIFLIIMLLNSPLALCYRAMPPSLTPADEPVSSSPTWGSSPPTDGDSGSSPSTPTWGSSPPTDEDSGSSPSTPTWGSSPPTDGDSGSSPSTSTWGSSSPNDSSSSSGGSVPTFNTGSFGFPSVPTSNTGSFGFPSVPTSSSGSFGFPSSFGKEQIDNYHRMEAGNIEKYCESSQNPTMCKNMILPYFKAATGIDGSSGGGSSGDSQP